MADYKTLADRIIADPSTVQEVDEIIREAMKDMGGNALYISLVYSGLALGVARIEGAFQSDSLVIVKNLRATNAAIDELLLGLPDDAPLAETLRDTRKEFQAVLDKRAEGAIAEQLQEMNQCFAVEPGLISGTIDPGDMPDAQLELLGWASGGRNQAYFAAWVKTQLDGSYGKMECHCNGCMTGLISFADAANSRTNVETLALKFTGVGAMFRQFGYDLLTYLRKSHTSLKEGTTVDGHGSDAVDAKALAADMISRVKGLPSMGGGNGQVQG